MDRQTNRQTDILVDRKTNRQAGRQRGRSTVLSKKGTSESIQPTAVVAAQPFRLNSGSNTHL